MKQFTTKEQTQHLIELGFPRPQTVINEYRVLELNPYGPIEFEYAYSIGELISFLVNPRIEDLAEIYRVEYDGANKPFLEEELIDALYNACIELKKEGVI